MKSVFKFRPKSISQKILAAIFVISSIVTLAITAIQLSYDYYQEINTLKKGLAQVEKSYSKSMITSLWELNEFQIQNQLDGITSIPGIQYASIEYKGRTLSTSGHLIDQSIRREIALYHYDREGNGTFLGNLIINADIEQVWNKIYNRIFIIFITQFFKTLLVSFLIYLSIQHLITRHIIHTSSFVKDIDFRHLKNPLILNRKKRPHTPDDELDTLSESINQMRENLYRSYNELNVLNKDLEQKVETKTQELLDQRKQMEYSSRMSSLGEMAAGIAHEINNPITIIGTSSHLMRKSVDSGKIDVKKLNLYFDKIDKTTDRVSKIINGLLALSRDASNEGYSSFTLKDVLSDVLSVCGEKFKYKNIAIDIQLDAPAFQAQIYGRRIQLSQVFLNLFNNSFDAIESFPERWIKIEANTLRNMLMISFTDSGKGIPKEIQEKIMQPFFTTKDVGRGTGLGLSLSMSIIKNHHGDFYIDTNCENTRFIIELPLNNEKNKHQ